MKLKNRIIPMLAGLLAAVVAVASSASAHSGDIFNGKFKWLLSSTNFILLIKDSALTNYLTKEAVYDGALTWNHISNKVNVSVVCYAPGMPTLAGQVTVYGKEFKDLTLGYTIPYDENGYPLDKKKDGYDMDWGYVSIAINTDPYAYSQGSGTLNTNQVITNARKTFIHEVGHALKLAHPKQNAGLSDHYIGGFPPAIMNQGFVGSKSGAVKADITYHDEYCLRAKWGA